MAKLVIIPVAAVLVLLLAGVAQATSICKAGYKDCDRNYYRNGCEVNIRTDVNNCGDCGHKCGALCGSNVIPVCRAGKCEFSCKPPFQNCGADWKYGCQLDVSKNVKHCGACNAKCVAPPYATATCRNHKCQYSCKPGYFNCDNDWSNGCEGLCNSDVNNCGGCGKKCKNVPYAVAKCQGGKCYYSCKPGYFNCDNDWSNGCEGLCNSDVNNCGGCGKKCKNVPYAVAKCQGGKCYYSCKPGYFNCDNDWSNGCEGLCNSDVNNCGGCGKKCKNVPYAVAKCQGGKCYYSCKPGYFNCDNDWSNGCEGLCNSDVNNCGGCGKKCKNVPYAVAKCQGGKCYYSCKPGYFNCDGDWTSGCQASCDSDVGNCGSYGRKCEDVPYAVAKCQGGKCDYSCKPGYFNCDGDWTSGCQASCDSDVGNCGSYGRKCEDVPYAVAKCQGGKCDYSCKPGYFNCDGDWTSGCQASCDGDAGNCDSCGYDADNCGSWGNKCDDVPYAVTECNDGKCEYSCEPGYANCDGDWSNGCECTTDTDVNHCGGCGNRCPVPNYAGGEAKCTYGKCETRSCKSGWKWDNYRSCCGPQ